MKRVLISHNNDLRANFFSERAVAELRSFVAVTLNLSDQPLAGRALVEAAAGHDIVISDRLARGTEEVFSALPDLVAYLRCAVDIRNIDVEAASRHGVLVCRCSSGYADAVAEMTLGLMIDLGRRISEAAALYHSGEAKHPMALTRQLFGATVGVIGYGSIGRRVAELTLAFGMRTLVYDPYVEVRHGGLRQVDLAAVLSEPDYVVCVPYATPETEGMMNDAAFARMRRDAFFINVSRGVVVDEDALERALLNGVIAGAALDVGLGHDQQPSLRIARLPNVVATPHVAGLTMEASEYQALENVRQVRDIIAGRVPIHAVNADRASRLRRFAS